MGGITRTLFPAERLPEDFVVDLWGGTKFGASALDRDFPGLFGEGAAAGGGAAF